MAEVRDLIQRYLATWNETDPDRRSAKLAIAWSEDARYVDPLAEVSGHDEISRLIGAVQEQAPGYVFRLLDSAIDAHHNVARFSWELVPGTGGDSVAVGFDVAETDGSGRISNVIGFLDKAPLQAA
jgi:SnoaL-like domain